MRGRLTLLALVALATLVDGAGSARAEPLRRRWPLIPALADAVITPPLIRKDLDEPCGVETWANPYSPLPKPMRQRHARVTLPMVGSRVELRDAYLIDAPRTITMDLVAPIDARLELGYRVIACGASKPIALRVVTEDTLGRVEELIPLAGKRTRAIGWRELALDLRVAPGLPFRLTLALETESKAGAITVALAEPALTGRPHDAPTLPTAADTNVLWVVIDAARGDALGPGRDFAIPTPTMDAVFARGAAFSRAYAMANQTRTSTTAMIASVHPSVGGFHSHDWAFARGRLDNFYKSSPPLVTTLLEAAGWRVAHLGNNFFLWGSIDVGIDAGFPHIVDFRSVPSDAIDASDHAISFFERHRDERWMLMLNYTAPHTPYQAPEEWDQAAKDMPGPARFGAHAHLPRSYLGELMWVDHNLTRVMQALERLELTERTLVIITADHGEVMYPWHDCRGGGGQRCGFNHSWTVYEDELWVPLVLALPGRLPSRVIDAPVSHVDLAPTILDVLGQPPAPGMGGRSLRALIEGAAPPEERPIYADGRRASSLRLGDWKLIVHSPDDIVAPRSRHTPEDGDTPRYELFDLAADPIEKKNLFRAEPEIVERLKGELARVRGELFTTFSERGATDSLAAGADAATSADESVADNRIMLVGGPDVRPLTGTIRAVGGRATCVRVTPPGQCVAQPDGAITVMIDAPIGGQATLAFTTTPWGAPLDLQLDAGWLGGPLPSHRLRLGAWGLALLRPGEALDAHERLALAARADPNAPPLPQPNETAVYFWRSMPADAPDLARPIARPVGFVAPEDAVAPGGDAQLGGEMRKVLKDLGYSN
ncbi:MAG: sulfatase [Deltaproteobacteria bacterium]|nr:sulfatase [Deltaproteobacteria bacterium]